MENKPLNLKEEFEMDEKKFSLKDIFNALDEMYDDVYGDCSYEDRMEHIWILDGAKTEIAKKLGVYEEK